MTEHITRWLRATALVALFAGAPPPAVADPSDPAVLEVRLRAQDAAAVLAGLERDGARHLAHLSPELVLVAAPAALVAAAEGVLEVSPWPPERAVVAELAAMAPAKAQRFASGVPVVLGVVGGGDPGRVEERLAAAGAEVRWTAVGDRLTEVGVLVPGHRWPQVLAIIRSLEGLVFADLQPPLRLRNAGSAWRCQSSLPGVTPVFDRGLHGEGQVVGIMDTGIDADMCFFADPEQGLPPVNDRFGTTVDPAQRKVLAVDFYWDADWPSPDEHAWDDQSHGTHVAGSVAGDDGGDGLHQGSDGMAPAARLVIQDGGYHYDPCADLPGIGCPVQPLEPVLQQAYDQGARLHSNSWGDEEEFWPPNRYTERTADVDRFSWEHRDFLVFFAAGNSGGWGPGTVGSPATGKNVVAVGATTHGSVEPPCPAGFSSRGWTADGRIKPDVMAPGHQVVSALSDLDVTTGNCGTAAFSGTSMATPTAAGLGALVRQYYADGFYPAGAANHGHGFVPSAALVKATLIAAAVDLRELGCTSVTPVPSRDQGWGLVVLDRALYFPGDRDRLLVDDHRHGFFGAADPPVRQEMVTGSGGPLKVVLVWTDPASSSAAAYNLVNDLDLEVSGPDGVFLGNVFSAGVSSAGGTPDRRNNVEVVWLPEAAAGAWEVTVRPHAIAVGGQDFALVVLGDLSHDPVRRLRQGGRIAP